MESTFIEAASVHGRFQPFHNDHLEYLLAAKQLCKHMIVGITSFNIRALQVHDGAPHRGIPGNNPMTYFERVSMIREALVDSGCDAAQLSFSPFPIETPEILPDFVPLSIPCFTTIREDWNQEKASLLESLGYQVKVLWRNNEKDFSGSVIRRLIATGDESWMTMVPQATVRAIARFGISERLRRSAENDILKQEAKTILAF